MSDFVKLGNRAKLRTQRPYDLAKVNAYLSIWGVCYIVTAFLMATEKDGNPAWWLIAAVVFLAMVAGNVLIYLKAFPLRLIGYVINIAFHYCMLLCIFAVVLPWTLRGTGLLCLLWWWNPCFGVIQNDKLLMDLEAESTPPADPQDDFDVPDRWDEAARRDTGGRGRRR